MRSIYSRTAAIPEFEKGIGKHGGKENEAEAFIQVDCSLERQLIRKR
jgi:hypothetical protein